MMHANLHNKSGWPADQNLHNNSGWTADQNFQLFMDNLLLKDKLEEQYIQSWDEKSGKMDNL